MLANKRSYALVVLIGVAPYLQADAGKERDFRQDDLHGVVHVSGAIYRDACRLGMTSAYQDIYVGDSKTSQLNRPGDRGDEVMFELRLEDCRMVSGSQTDERSALLRWSESQPLVSVRFVAENHKDNPRLVAVNGAEGFGLRITDNQQRDINLGGRGTPLFLEPGSNSLIYHITPERTSSPLEAGAWDAFVRYELIYD
ncbi:fimbrial protein [Enterobacter kobei]